jgi:hypothetical protein
MYKPKIGDIMQNKENVAPAAAVAHEQPNTGECLSFNIHVIY